MQFAQVKRLVCGQVKCSGRITLVDVTVKILQESHFGNRIFITTLGHAVNPENSFFDRIEIGQLQFSVDDLNVPGRIDSV